MAKEEKPKKVIAKEQAKDGFEKQKEQAPIGEEASAEVAKEEKSLYPKCMYTADTKLFEKKIRRTINHHNIIIKVVLEVIN